MKNSFFYSLLLMVTCAFFSGCPDDDPLDLPPVERRNSAVFALSNVVSPPDDEWQGLPDSTFRLVNENEGLLFYSDSIYNDLPCFDLVDLCFRRNVELSLYQDSLLLDVITVDLKELDDSLCTLDEVRCDQCDFTLRFGALWIVRY